MRKSLDDIIKEKLEHYEAPSDSSTWQKIESRLDGANGAHQFSLKKWAAAISLIAVAVGIGSYLLLSDSESKQEIVKTQKLENPSEVEQKNNKQVSTVDDKTQTTPSQLVENDIQIDETENTESKKSSTEHLTQESKELVGDSKENTQQNTPITEEQTAVNEEKTAERRENSTPDDGNSGNIVQKQHFIPGSVDQLEVCSGEAVTLRNEGGQNDMVRASAAGEIINLSAGKAKTIHPTQDLNLTFLDDKNNVIRSLEIMVHEKSNPDFAYECNVYEKGLPVLELRSLGEHKTHSWIINGEKKLEGKEVKVNTFDRGQYDVKLEIVDLNGCKSAKEKKVNIEKVYNLMAVSAFSPGSNSPKNKTFMPFALKERDVQFKMTIIDPRDNHVIFTSHDKDQPWDGVDQRTGKRADREQIYVWRVQLENPEAGEAPVYAGTVLMK